MNKSEKPVLSKQDKEHKKVVYQVFTRLFGNTNTTNKPWGTIEENGVGKFNDFTDKALQELKGLGVTHMWYTGVLHHATITDYTLYGISNDDPDIVKGRAGSPYAVKDYYNVDPDLAEDQANRLDEFEDLIKRTHKNGMKVMLTITLVSAQPVCPISVAHLEGAEGCQPVAWQLRARIYVPVALTTGVQH